MKIRCKVCGNEFEKKNVRAVTCDRCLSFNKSKLAGLLKDYKKIFTPGTVLSKAYISRFYTELYSDEMQQDIYESKVISKGSIHKISVWYSSSNFVITYMESMLMNFVKSNAIILGADSTTFTQRCNTLIDMIKTHTTRTMEKNRIFISDVLVGVGMKHYYNITPIIYSLDLLYYFSVTRDVSFIFKKTFMYDILCLLLNGLACEEKALSKFNKPGSVR